MVLKTFSENEAMATCDELRDCGHSRSEASQHYVKTLFLEYPMNSVVNNLEDGEKKRFIF